MARQVCVLRPAAGVDVDVESHLILKRGAARDGDRWEGVRGCRLALAVSLLEDDALLRDLLNKGREGCRARALVSVVFVGVVGADLGVLLEVVDSDAKHELGPLAQLRLDLNVAIQSLADLLANGQADSITEGIQLVFSRVL